MNIDMDIVVYAVVAIALALWLRSILGTRGADEPTRPNPFAAPLDGAPLKPMRGLVGQQAAPAIAAPVPVLAPNMAITNPAAQETLSAIARADKRFDLARFMHNAQDAFVMIVEAFAHGDRATLQKLLSESVYAAFSRVLDERAAAGQSASVEIHAVRRIEAVEAALEGQQASVTVRFVSDQTDLLHDSSGTVIQGNPDRVREIVDIWTFSRDLRAKEPTWLVTGTREETPVEPNPAAPPAA